MRTRVLPCHQQGLFASRRSLCALVVHCPADPHNFAATNAFQSSNTAAHPTTSWLKRAFLLLPRTPIGFTPSRKGLPASFKTHRAVAPIC